MNCYQLIISDTVQDKELDLRAMFHAFLSLHLKEKRVRIAKLPSEKKMYYWIILQQCFPEVKKYAILSTLLCMYHFGEDVYVFRIEAVLQIYIAQIQTGNGFSRISTQNPMLKHSTNSTIL